jgi:hypothetical protein
MKKLLFVFFISLQFMVFSQNSEFPRNFDDLPCYGYSDASVDQDLISPVSGEIVDVETNDNLSIISIECSHDYYLNGSKQIVTYEILISGIIDFVNIKNVEEGAIIGKVSFDTKIVSRSKILDPYMIRLTSVAPFKLDSFYYYAPSWLIPTNTSYLSFRQVDSLEDAVIDFYNRWNNEEEEKADKGATLHHFPEYDRIRVKIKLEEYPSQLVPNTGLGLTVMTYYGNAQFVYENKIESNCKYKPVIYWQKGFLDYLKDEYTLGNDIYIYCSIFALDHDVRKIVICARDFTLKSDEEIIKERISEITY